MTKELETKSFRRALQETCKRSAQGTIDYGKNFIEALSPTGMNFCGTMCVNYGVIYFGTGGLLCVSGLYAVIVPWALSATRSALKSMDADLPYKPAHSFWGAAILSSIMTVGTGVMVDQATKMNVWEDLQKNIKESTPPYEQDVAFETKNGSLYTYRIELKPKDANKNSPEITTHNLVYKGQVDKPSFLIRGKRIQYSFNFTVCDP